MSLLKGQKLVIASHNAGKLREFGELVAPFGIEVTSAGELGISEPEETGLTFEANAELKALHSANASGLTALVVKIRAKKDPKKSSKISKEETWVK